NGKARETKIEKGIHFVNVPLDSVVFFVRQGKLVPLANSARSVDFLKSEPAQLLGDGDRYELYDDDGFTRDTKIEGHLREIVRKR
ncbi:MAG: alpha-glucosidase, partial [Treponema sp.]|nr:alpha-glucosidase [Treponema sp.]